MASPWLDVPLAEYEGHMELAGQASMLDQIFGRALRAVRPRSVAVLGAAGGNGFGHLAECKVARTVAVDLNPAYLKELERRYRDLVQDLEIVCGDLGDPATGFAPVDLIYAALVFEYVDLNRTLERIQGWMQPGGALWVVLQLPDRKRPGVTPSPFKSLSGLGNAMTLRNEGEFRKAATLAGFIEDSDGIITTPGGKRFFSACYRGGVVSRSAQKT